MAVFRTYQILLDGPQPSPLQYLLVKNVLKNVPRSALNVYSIFYILVGAGAKVRLLAPAPPKIKYTKFSSLVPTLIKRLFKKQILKNK